VGIPAEECSFFVLAAAFTSLVRLAFWPRTWADAARPAPVMVGSLAAAVALALGTVACVAAERTLYLGLLLVWATPVLWLQWAVGGHVLMAHAGPLARTVLLAGGALAMMDRWAIQRNIWVLNPEWTLWPWARGLHPEEVLFFFLTSAMCANGLTLALWVDAGFAPALRVCGRTICLRVDSSSAAK